MNGGQKATDKGVAGYLSVTITVKQVAETDWGPELGVKLFLLPSSHFARGRRSVLLLCNSVEQLKRQGSFSLHQQSGGRQLPSQF